MFFYKLAIIKNFQGHISKIDKLINNNHILYFIIILFFILPQIKLVNTYSTYFDLQIYINKIKDIENFLIYKNKSHIEIILIFFHFLNQLVQKNFLFVKILLFLQSFILICPIFFLKTNKLLYLLNPIIWNLNIFDFHTESLAVPVLFLIFFYLYREKYNKIFILSIILLLIKETYLILLPSVWLYIILNKLKIKYQLSFLLIFIYLILILIFYQFFIKVINFETDIIFKITTLKYFFFIFIQILLFLFIDKKNKFYFFISFFIPINFIFLIHSSINQISIFTHHFSYVALPILFIIFYSYNKFKVLFINLILLFSFSAFPISIVSLSSYFETFSINNYFFNSQNISYRNFIKNNFEMLNKYKLIVDNNAINDVLTNFNDINPYPIINNFNEDFDSFVYGLQNYDDLLFIIKKSYYYFDIDQKVFNLNLKREYLLNANKIIFFENDDFLIFSINN